MGIFKKYVNQVSKPEGFLGKMMIDTMNGGHAKMADWGMSHLQTIAPDEILEVGCGGGKNAFALMKKYPSSKLTAIDYSELSVEKAKAYNADMIARGRCKVQQGNVAELNMKEQFDLATAFETIYFWPGLEKCFGEVNKALKPGGTFMIVNESDGMDKASLGFEKIVEGMKCHTIDDIKSALKGAGFKKVVADHHGNKAWITVIAKK